MRTWTFLGTTLALLLLTSSTAAADAGSVRQQMEELATAIEQVGQWENAARLRGFLDATPDEELEQVYGRTDLTPLISAFQQAGALRGNAVARVTSAREAIEAAQREARERKLRTPPLASRALSADDFPEADYPNELEFCPTHALVDGELPRRSRAMDTLELARDLNITILALEQVENLRSLAKNIWSGLSRACDQFVAVLFGGNLSVACIPADIVFAAAELVVAEVKWAIGIAQSNLELVAACDAAVTSEELAANYDRSKALHDDLEAFRTEVETQLDALDEKWALVLRVLLERDLQWNSGPRMAVNYGERLKESCDATEQAILDAKALGYKVPARAEENLALARTLFTTDPKAALDLCRTAYRLTTR